MTGQWVRVEFYGLVPEGQAVVDVKPDEVAATLGRAFGFTHVDGLSVVDSKPPPSAWREVIAPGAFDGQLPAQVPVTNSAGARIGTAQVWQDDQGRVTASMKVTAGLPERTVEGTIAPVSFGFDAYESAISAAKMVGERGVADDDRLPREPGSECQARFALGREVLGCALLPGHEDAHWDERGFYWSPEPGMIPLIGAPS